MTKLISHIEGLCDAKGCRLPYKVPFEATPDLIKLAEEKVEVNGVVMLTFADEDKKVDDNAVTETSADEHNNVATPDKDITAPPAEAGSTQMAENSDDKESVDGTPTDGGVQTNSAEDKAHKFMCPECDFGTDDQRIFSGHVKIQHPDVAEAILKG